MRLRWIVLLAVATASAMVGSSARAINSAAYLVQRAKVSAIPLPATERSSALTARIGQVFELTGVVTGSFASNGRAGFLLKTSADETLILTAAAEDPDVIVASRLRVLARAVDGSSFLESVGVTPDVSTPQAATSVAPAPPLIPDTIASPPPVQRASWTTGGSLADNPDVVQRYADKIREINSRIESPVADKIAYHLLAKSEQYDVDPRLTFALITQESRFNPNAVSRAGAQGLGQLMPGTASSLGVRNPFDIESNIDGAVRYLSTQLRAFGRLSLALAAYNAGPGAVRRYGGIPPYRETQHYVRTIWLRYADLAGIDPDTGQLIATR